MSTKIVEGEHGRLLKLDPSSTDPVLQRAAVTAVAGLIAGVAARYGLPLSEGWADAVAVTLVVGLPLLAGWWARRKAWSGATVAEVLDRQLDQVTRP